MLLVFAVITRISSLTLDMQFDLRLGGGREVAPCIWRLLSALVALAAASLLFVPFDITQLSIPDKLQTPNEMHWLGTDHFGRDILSMIMIGARTSLAVALWP